MVKKKEGTEELIEEAAEEVAPPAEEAEPKEETPTEEKDWKSEFDKVSNELNRMTEGYKGLQKTLNRVQADNKGLSDFHSRLDEMDAKFKIIAALQAEKGNLPSEDMESLPQEKRVDLLKQYEGIEKDLVAKRKQRELAQKISGFQERTVALGLSEDDPEYWDIEDAAVSGKFQKAEALLRKMEKTKEGKAVTMPNEPKGSTESEEQIFERIARQKGLLKADSLQPGGRARTPQDTLKAYIAGEIGEEEYAKERDKLPREI